MNRKWSGSVAGAWLILLSFSLLLLSCAKETPGNPEKTVKDYIKAVQKSDFKTIYRLNRVTARQKMYIEKTKNGDIQKLLKASFETHKAAYDTAEPGFFSGALWSEKYYFPPTSTVSVGEARDPYPAGDDPVNSEYEKGFTLFVPVKTFYTKSRDTPELDGRKLKEAVYDCVLGKIRYGRNVRIYSNDEHWFLSGCILDRSSVTFFLPKKPE